MSKLGQRSPGIKPARPAPPPPVAGPKAPEVEAVKEGGATQASPKTPQKPAPYGSTNQRSSVADLTQQCNNRDSEVVGGVGGRSRMGSGLPPKSTVRSPTRGEWEGKGGGLGVGAKVCGRSLGVGEGGKGEEGRVGSEGINEQCTCMCNGTYMYTVGSYTFLACFCFRKAVLSLLVNVC